MRMSRWRGRRLRAVGALKKRSLIGDADRSARRAGAEREQRSPRSRKFGDRIVGTLRDYLIDPEMRAEVRREIPKVLAGDRHAGGAGGAGRERARSRCGAALSHHRGAQPPRPGASGSADRSQADRDGARRRDHGPLPLLPGARHARRRAGRRRPIRSSTACANRWRRRRSGSSGC